MRITTDRWTMSGAVKIGHRHAVIGENCQDAVSFGDHDGSIFGVVCDGCGSGSNSEVGSKLVAEYAGKWLLGLLRARMLIQDIPACLYVNVLRFIQRSSRMLALATESWNTPAALAEHINTFWLCTILGFVRDKDHLIVFSAGDGVFSADGPCVIIDENNEPKYLAYRALEQPQQFGVTESHMPKEGFVTIECPADTAKFMIATDGFVNHCKMKLNASKQRLQKELPDDLHGDQWGKKGEVGLKKWLNVCSGLGYFDDDCALITVETL